MTSRGILFSAPMVRAIGAGVKTETRRVITPQPVAVGQNGPLISFNHGVPEYSFSAEDRTAKGDLRWWRCPYGQAGDELWVRETWATVDEHHAVKPSQLPHDAPMHYFADAADLGEWGGRVRGKKRVAIHLPEALARTRLKVSEVRIHRLQDITEADAEREGAPRGGWDDDGRFYENPLGTYYAGFAGLWESINGKNPAKCWDANPFVWAVSWK